MVSLPPCVNHIFATFCSQNLNALTQIIHCMICFLLAFLALFTHYFPLPNSISPYTIIQPQWTPLSFYSVSLQMVSFARNHHHRHYPHTHDCLATPSFCSKQFKCPVLCASSPLPRPSNAEFIPTSSLVRPFALISHNTCHSYFSWKICIKSNTMPVARDTLINSTAQVTYLLTSSTDKY